MDEPTPTTMALDDFTAFLDKHRRCEDLNVRVQEPQFGHQRLWASCVSLSRNLRTDEDSGHYSLSGLTNMARVSSAEKN